MIRQVVQICFTPQILSIAHLWHKKIIPSLKFIFDIFNIGHIKITPNIYTPDDIANAKTGTHGYDKEKIIRMLTIEFF